MSERQAPYHTASGPPVDTDVLPTGGSVLTRMPHATAAEVQSLREQVERLERRVGELEERG